MKRKQKKKITKKNDAIKRGKAGKRSMTQRKEKKKKKK